MNPPIRRPRVSLARRFHLERLETREVLANFAVTNVADSGPGSLRQAILDADAGPVPSGVIFQIPASAATRGTKLAVIAPTTPLPALGNGVVLFGPTEELFTNGADGIAIDGSKLKASAIPGGQGEGLVVAGDHAGVLGLIVDGFSGDQILVAGKQDVIQGVDIRTSATGSPMKTGISLLGATEALIAGNTTGPPSGISGAGLGIFIGPGSSGNRVEGYQIYGNSYAGIFADGATANTIGGTTPAERNAISNNGLSGVIVADPTPPSMAKPEYNVIEGNGLAFNGYPGDPMAALEILSSSGNVIGSDGGNPSTFTSGSNSIVSNYADGIIIGASPFVANPAFASGNLIENNFIGGYISPSDPANGNQGDGIAIVAGGMNNLVRGNTITDNGGDAISDAGKADQLVGNAESNNDNRHSNFTLGRNSLPSKSPFAIGSTVPLDYTVTNQGPGYATGAVLVVDYSGPTELTLVSAAGATATVTQIWPSRLKVVFSYASNSASSPGKAGSFGPGGSATIQLQFKAAKAGTGVIRANVAGVATIDSNLANKADTLSLMFR